MARMAGPEKMMLYPKRILSSFLLMVLLAVVLVPLAAHAGVVRLSVAASMTDAFKELVRTFQVSNPHITVIANYASSGSLAKQIVQGAPADLYVSANQKWMAYLVEKEKIVPYTVHVFAYNTLVFVGKKEIRLNRLQDIRALSRIAIGSPKSVPVGQYAAQALRVAGIYDELAADHKLVMAKDVRQALLYADRGEVDGAFVYRTEARLARNGAILLTVPEGHHDSIVYPLGLTKDGTKNSEAQALWNYLKSAEAFAVLARYGFTSAAR